MPEGRTPPTRADVTATAGATATSDAGARARDDARAVTEVAPPHPAAATYELGKEIGRGGMGRVLRARDRRLGREVAIKELIRPGREARRRFEREARITAVLQHPAIVPVYEVATDGDADPYYVMRLVSGVTLSERVAAATPEERRGLVRHVLVVAEAMAYAHGQRFIHRDLKASNVIVGELGDTVVIDWGLARRLGEDDAAAPDAGPARFMAPGADDELTVAGAVMGTPAYMPPEQAAGDPIDERADVYAIGAMLYHTLTGAVPYRARTSKDILAEVIAGPPAPLLEVLPDLPRDLAAIVSRAMSREPAARYPTARELAADLGRYTTGQLVASHRYAPRELVARWIRRHRAAVAVAAVAVVAGALGAAVAVRNVIEARDRARADRVIAERERATAEAARREATARADDAILASARAELAADPRAAIERLRSLSAGAPQWAHARPLVADALARGVAFPLGHADDVGSAAVAGDGAVIVAGRGGVLRAPAGAAGTWDRAYGAAVSPDGGAVARFERGTITVENGGTTHQVEVPGAFEAMALGPGGQRLVVAAAGNIYVIEVATGTRRLLGPGPDDDGPWRLRFSDDGAYVLARRRTTLTAVWRVDGAATGLPARMWGFASSADGRWRAHKEYEGDIVVHDTRGGERRIDSRGGGLLELSPGGRWLVWFTPFESEGHVFDLRTSKAHLLRGHTGVIQAVAFDGRGDRLATTGSDGTARVWDLSWIDVVGEPATAEGGSDAIPTFDLGETGIWVAFTPGGDALAVAGVNGRVWRWPIAAPAQRRMSGGPVLSPDGRWVAEMLGNRVAVSPRGGGEVRHLEGVHRVEELDAGPHVIDQVPAPVFAAASPVLVAAGDGAVLRWDLDRGAVERWPVPRAPARGLDGGSDAVAVSADGRWVATHATTDEVHLVTAGQPAWLVTKVPERAALAFSADARHLAVCGQEARVFRVADSAVVRLPAGSVCAFSPAGDQIAIGGVDEKQPIELSLCTLADQRCRTIAGGAGARSVRIAGSGRLVAELGQGQVVTWFDAGAPRQDLGRHRGSLADLQIADDGSRVVSVGRGAEVMLWDLPSGAGRLLRAPLSVVEAALLEDGAVSLTDGFTVTRWADDLPRDEAGLRARIDAALAPR